MRTRATAAISVSGSACTELNCIPVAVSRHGRDRPLPPPASSTKPYLASCRRWNEQVVGDSLIRSPTSVAVIAPPRSRASMSAMRTG